MICAIMPPIDRPTHMRPIDGEGIEQADCVGSHVGKGIGNLRPPPGHERGGQRAEVRRGAVAKMRRASGVAIVEADHTIAACRQFLAERRGPTDHLHAQPGDQQDRRIGLATEMIPGQIDAIGFRDIHGRALSGSRRERQFGEGKQA